ncbi:hypothetical protein [Candidatus Uabimicrobium sp. HlEnr_7]|uniref:hypothetical protein n=1 Tax=Candidatus Uabimicrobium helgolandensis TaxID=3095367 RepID=UPI003558469C
MTKPKKGSSIGEKIVVIFLLFGIMAILDGPISSFFIYLLTGWSLYLGDLGININLFSYRNIKILFLFLGTVVGFRYTLRWIHSHRETDSHLFYSWRRSFALVCIMVVIVIASTATIGIIHQIGWLSRDGIEMTNSSNMIINSRVRSFLHNEDRKSKINHLREIQKKWTQYNFVWIDNEKLETVTVIPVPSSKHYPQSLSIRVHTKMDTFSYYKLTAEEIIDSLKQQIIPKEENE